MAKHPEHGEDEVAALSWLDAQRAWLRQHEDEPVPEVVVSQTIHGDYHDANVVFRAGEVAGVIDWDKAEGACPLEEMIRAIHLSFRLHPVRSAAFVAGYRTHASVTAKDLDAAARRYGFHRDRSLWLFDELYRGGNERLRPLLNHGNFVPFESSWDAVRAQF